MRPMNPVQRHTSFHRIAHFPDCKLQRLLVICSFFFKNFGLIENMVF